MDIYNALFDNIWVEESFFLGWEFQDKNLMLYFELYLLSGHPLYDKNCVKCQPACYKLATLTITNAKEVAGLKPGMFKPEWNKELGEYTALEDLVTIQIIDSILMIEMEFRVIRVDFEQLNLKIFETQLFDF